MLSLWQPSTYALKNLVILCIDSLRNLNPFNINIKNNFCVDHDEINIKNLVLIQRKYFFKKKIGILKKKIGGFSRIFILCDCTLYRYLLRCASHVGRGPGTLWLGTTLAYSLFDAVQYFTSDSLPTWGTKGDYDVIIN